MAGAIAREQAQRIRAVLDSAFNDADLQTESSAGTRAAFATLIDVLESNDDAIVLPADTLLTTGQVAKLLGVSRMTVTRLVDRGELAMTGSGPHRRISAAEVSRYRTASRDRRRAALHTLADEITDDTPADRVIPTR